MLVGRRHPRIYERRHNTLTVGCLPWIKEYNSSMIISWRVHGMSQIYTLPDVCVRQLNTTITWFVWKSDIFRVPLSPLYRTKEEGGWDLTNLPTKSHALLIPYATTCDETRNNIVGLDADMGPKCERSQTAISRCHSPQI